MKNFVLPVIIMLLLGCHPPRQRVYDRASVKVQEGQMVKLSNTNGVVLLDFTSFTSNGVCYRWRFFDFVDKKETSGEGEVWETSKWLTYQSSSDSNLYIRSGGIWLPWSYASITSVWIYYTAEKTTIDILPNIGFCDEKLIAYSNLGDLVSGYYNSPSNSVSGKPSESGVKTPEDDIGN